MSGKKLSRSVSIIGVGSTKFGSPFETEELKDLSFQEYGAWAVMDALEDANVNPREVDHLCVGSVSSPTNNALNISPQFGFLEWCGMKGKSANYQCAGCASGLMVFDQAVDMVAGGRCDIVVAVDMEINQTVTAPNRPSHMRYPFSEYANLYGYKPLLGVNGVDTSYQRWLGAQFIAQDSCGRHYMKDTGISQDDLEDGVIGACVTCREHGALGPDCYLQTTFDEVAASYGYDNVTDYMKGPMDPYFSDMNRVNYTGVMCEGAAAVVICASDIAKNYTDKAVEVVNVIESNYSVGTPDNERKMNRDLADQIYESTGYKPEDIEYLATTNMDQYDMIDSAEALGYLPKGEGWKYFRDGKTRFDAEKPINTDGGTQGLGHAYAASALHNYKELVLQMRGEAGDRQIPNPPKVAMMRGQGATHVATVAIMRMLED